MNHKPTHSSLRCPISPTVRVGFPFLGSPYADALVGSYVYAMQIAPEMHIRRASPDDAGVLRAILHDTFENTWLPELTAAAARRCRDEDRPAAYICERGAEFRVAECEGQVVGFVDWDADFVNALHVRSSHARRGIGSRLMDLAENEIAGAGFLSARIETDTFNSRARLLLETRISRSRSISRFRVEQRVNDAASREVAQSSRESEMHTLNLLLDEHRRQCTE